jgi:hypothetical protein
MILVSNTPGQDSGSRKLVANKTTYAKLTIRSAPKFTLQISGGYDYGVYELSGNNNGDFSSEEFEKGENFGVRHGFGGSVTLKVALHQKGNIRLNISALYNEFSSKYSKMNVGFYGPEFVNYDVYSGVIGVENNFTPNFKFKTMVGGGFIASVISGNARIYSENSPVDLNIIPAFRLGVTVFSGAEYALNNWLGVNFGFRFTHANLWFKQTKESDNPNEVYLNDKRVSPRMPYSGFRQFAWGSFNAGVNFYFGIKEKQYIIKQY